jgi:Ribonucleotide reductase, beta subunit
MKEIEELWKRALEEAWNPYKINIEKDAEDWVKFNDEQKKYLADLFFHQLLGEYEVLTGVSILINFIKEKDARLFLQTHARDNTVHANIFERFLLCVGEKDFTNLKERVSRSYYELVYIKPRALLNELEKYYDEEKIVKFMTLYYLATDGILYNTSYIALDQLIFSNKLLKNLNEAYKKINIDEKRQTMFAAYYIKYLSEQNKELVNVVRDTLNDSTQLIISTIGYFSNLAESFGRSIDEFASLAQGVIDDELKVIGLK